MYELAPSLSLYGVADEVTVAWYSAIAILGGGISKNKEKKLFYFCSLLTYRLVCESITVYY